MSVNITPTVTAIPVPTEPPKVPDRWVDVKQHVDTNGGSITTNAWVDPINEIPMRGYVRFLLPGTDLTAALAELERASEELESFWEAGYSVTQMAQAITALLEARRRVRELTLKGAKP